jgi:hypothetical protein
MFDKKKNEESKGVNLFGNSQPETGGLFGNIKQSNDGSSNLFKTKKDTTSSFGGSASAFGKSNVFSSGSNPISAIGKGPGKSGFMSTSSNDKMAPMDQDRPSPAKVLGKSMLNIGKNKLTTTTENTIITLMSDLRIARIDEYTKSMPSIYKNVHSDPTSQKAYKSQSDMRSKQLEKLNYDNMKLFRQTVHDVILGDTEGMQVDGDNLKSIR